MSRAIRMAGAVERGEAITIIVDGEHVPAYRGETVAAAMLASGIRTMRYTRREHEPRGLYCGMGVCFECVVRLEGAGPARSCITFVADGMKVWTTER
jgi:sarcosine oxidase subunit alpha